jgi:hypothetical protein
MSKCWIAMLAFALAACHMDTPGAPKFSGPVTLTVEVDAVGLLTSDPAGIECGQCIPLGSAPPCADTAVKTTCSADFDAGSGVTLILDARAIYFATHCTSPELPADHTSCSFEITQPMLVRVTGVEA